MVASDRGCIDSASTTKPCTYSEEFLFGLTGICLWVNCAVLIRKLLKSKARIRIVFIMLWMSSQFIGKHN